ncbi:MAG: amidohydrolase [Candidatus Cloacimonetes bacterium]|nr:amidohydrolase [Candidatus Cloacimonadota bacterium]
MDYIFCNGNIYGHKFCEAVLVRNEQILFTGSLFEAKVKANNPKYIDLKGKLLFPALTDSHTHFVQTAKNLLTIDLHNCNNAELFFKRLCDYREKYNTKIEWILGYGWEKEHIDKFKDINRSMLDKVFPDIPVSLSSKDLHSTLCNSKALDIVGITKQSNFEGIVIGKSSNGELNGFLYEQSWTVLSKYIPKFKNSLLSKLLRELIEKSWQFGLCGVHSFEDLDSAFLVKDILEELPFYCIWYYLDKIELCQFVNETRRFINGGIKLFSDGSMGSDSAWMFESQNTLNLEEQIISLKKDIAFYDNLNIQTSVHAIGDLAVNKMASIFREIYVNSKYKVQHRIEHLQAVRSEDLLLLKQAHIYASMQAIHLKNDIKMINDKWKVAKDYAFPLKSMYDNDIILSLGSDSPVETLNPFVGMYSAINRKADNDASNETFLKNECLTLDETIKAYSINHFRVANKDIKYGLIEKGLQANLIIIDDITRSPIDILLDIKPYLTMIDGHIVYSQNNI